MQGPDHRLRRAQGHVHRGGREVDGPVPGVRRLIEADEGRLIANRTQFSVGWRMIAYPH